METVAKANELIIEADLWCLVLLHDGSRVVIGCKDGNVWVWNHLTNITECQMSGHSNWVECVAFSYDGCHVVSGSGDKTVRIWDCHTGNEVALYQHSDEVSLSLTMVVMLQLDSGMAQFGHGIHQLVRFNASQ